MPGNELSIPLPENFCQLTWKEWRFQDSTQNISSVSNIGYMGQSKQDSRYETNQNAFQLLAFKMGIKTEVS